MKRMLATAAAALFAMMLFGLAGTYGASYYYSSQHGAGCGSCHEMADYVAAVHASPHRNATCIDCHQASVATKLRHIKVHLSGKLPEAIRLRDVDVVGMTVDCQKCHRAEYAKWRAGPHSATYREIFTNTTHNSRRRMMDDCFRCHGMHFDGSIRDLVQPQDSHGPWRIVRSGLADQPTMPCQSCHWVHREGAIQRKQDVSSTKGWSPVHDSLAFFDRRERLHFAASTLVIPSMYDGARKVRMNSDQLQALCYQCHAPREPEVASTEAENHWGVQVGSGDDRTPVGVHEGLSCNACHNGHNEDARASCTSCHPEMSHCGIAVEKMDTTYANRASKHNIHWVKCLDCHQHGVPQIKKRQPGGAGTGQTVAAASKTPH